jgi:hypothetical protein
MRFRRIPSALGAAAGVAIAVAMAGAEEPKMAPQKPISHPLVTALVGTWNTKISGSITGTGVATFVLGVGGTALLQDEQGEHKMGPSGPAMKTAGHGVYKVSDDGNTMSVWWIDNHAPEMVKATGPATADGYELSAQSPQGPFRIVMKRTATGFEFAMFMGDQKEPHYKQTYEKAAR